MALNEFPALEADFESAATADALLATCQDAGCANHAAALGLLLCDEAAVADFAAQHPQVCALGVDLSHAGWQQQAAATIGGSWPEQSSAAWLCWGQQAMQGPNCANG